MDRKIRLTMQGGVEGFRHEEGKRRRKRLLGYYRGPGVHCVFTTN